MCGLYLECLSYGCVIVQCTDGMMVSCCKNRRARSRQALELAETSSHSLRSGAISSSDFVPSSCTWR